MDNLIKDMTELLKFRDDRLQFIVSSRRITPDVSIMDYLKIHYIFIKPEQAKYVFGSVTIDSKLYGGRKYDPYHSLTEKHVRELYDHNIGVSLNLTNHFFDKKAYEDSLPLLEQFHSPDNSIIITNDELAKNIKRDFPDYKLKASIIKNIRNIKRLENAFELFDYVTLPMDMNDDDEFLNSISQKEKVILFGNANCAYTCPARTCYYGFSQYNRGEEETSVCSKETMPRLDCGPVYFDVEKLADMGFTHFKLIPLFFEEADRITKHFSWKKKSETNYYKKPDAFVVSYPKSGRTWLRFILANYLNSLYKLDLNIDLHNFFHLLPNDTDDEIKGLKGFNFYHNDKIPFILFTHKRNNEIDYSGKTIFLLRSPYDIMVSDYFQQAEHLNRYKGSIKEFIRNEKTGINKLCDFFNSWSKTIHKKSAFVLSYEELTQTTDQVIETLLHYLDIKIEKDILKTSIISSNFNTMQNLEKKEGLSSDRTYNRDNVNALRMREGKTGAYKKYLDEEDIRYITSILREKLEKNVLKQLIKHDCMRDLYIPKVHS